ncbi:tryptophan-rich sensory protein [bacterium]|nr:MAG: tryptophan-rich sensory protein [bacterium]
MRVVVSRPPTSPVIKFLLMATGVYAVAFIGAQATFTAPDYYTSLLRPKWAPPAWLFGPVWTILYGMMAVAAYLVWTVPREDRRGALVLFWVQLALNGLWSWLFFAWRQTFYAGIEIAVLWLAIVATGFLFFRVRPLTGWLLVPYLLWVTFATALNWSIYALNR